MQRAVRAQARARAPRTAPVEVSHFEVRHLGLAAVMGALITTARCKRVAFTPQMLFRYYLSRVRGT